MTFSDPYSGKSDSWWVEVTHDDGFVQAMAFSSHRDALEFTVDPDAPTRANRLRERFGDVLPDPSAGYQPLFKRITQPPAELPKVPETPLPPIDVHLDVDEETEALKRDNELQRLRIENAELREGVKTGKLPTRLAARDFVTGAIGASVWAIAEKFIGC